jgi:hypothetical protein
MIVIKEKEVETSPKTESVFTPPPPITVSGKVTNDKGEPLSGATVTEKGTS